MKKKALISAPAMLIVFVSVLALTPLLFLHAKTAAVKTTSGELSQTPLLPPGDEDGDKTLSPYFYVSGGDGKTESLPLKKTSADVVIAGVIADVTIEQMYVNTGEIPLEAIYIFPASTRAAVYDLTMKIGDRILKAVIQGREQARNTYEQAKNEGRSATLLEQQRPNVFQMNVANIMPGDTIVVAMKYTELLVPESGVYEFVYPAVTGPRYSNKAEATAAADDKWVSNPYTHSGEKPLYDFGIHIRILAGVPLQDIRCPSHQMDISYSGASEAVVRLGDDKAGEGNRDVILQYRLAGGKIHTGLMLSEGEKDGENFFLAMVQPPEKPSQSIIPAREYIFIVDVSGSMYGFPLDVSKKLLKNLISGLKPTDKFNVLLFAGSASLLSETSVNATEDNLARAIKLIDQQRGGGGTELLPALKKAMAVEKLRGVSRTFVIATDGYVDVEKESFTIIRENLDKANFFAFGIGSSVNRFLIEGIAHAGMGEAFIVTDGAEAEKQAEKFRKYISTPVLTDVKISYDGFEVYDVEPLRIPDLLAERPLIIYGKWKGRPEGKITVRGSSGGEKFVSVLDVASAASSSPGNALKYLWARQRIRMLDDFNKAEPDSKTAEEITALGLRYNLLTQYTSFVAVDSLIRNAGGNPVTIKQPLPMPQGVSDYAVGGYGYASGKSMNKQSVNVCYDASPVPAEHEESETVLNKSATVPHFSGGEKAMKKFIADNFVKPLKASQAGISGTIHISMLVTAAGELQNVTVIKGLGYGCDEEAVRVVQKMKGKWIPAMQNGVAVPASITIQIKV